LFLIRNDSEVKFCKAKADIEKVERMGIPTRLGISIEEKEG
jgi:hypothetical protein